MASTSRVTFWSGEKFTILAKAGSTYALTPICCTIARNKCTNSLSIVNPDRIFTNASLQSFSDWMKKTPSQNLYHACPKINTGFPRTTASHPAVPVIVTTVFELSIKSKFDDVIEIN